ncbi:MAG TPA: YdcF family protein [Hyphomicrobiales bacterium]|nr:YdcF family protein [Hyphomicrobiales bacterium]
MPQRPRLLRRLLPAAAIGAALAAGLFVIGFGIFVAAIPRQPPAAAPSADAVVALTGGADRIADAVALLARGQAGRLLITGVNPETTDRELARLHPRSAALLDCCVDVDRRALNTAGNAIEAGEWVRARGFHRVIVVTSAWHMPRSLVELGRELPGVELVPYPVVTARSAQKAWWRDDDTWRLLATEYVKYLAALVDIRLAPQVAPDQPVAGRAGAPA